MCNRNPAAMLARHDLRRFAVLSQSSSPAATAVLAAELAPAGVASHAAVVRPPGGEARRPLVSAAVACLGDGAGERRQRGALRRRTWSRPPEIGRGSGGEKVGQ